MRTGSASFANSHSGERVRRGSMISSTQIYLGRLGDRGG